MNRILAIALLLSLMGCTTKLEEIRDPFEELTGFVDQYAERIVEQGKVSSISVGIYKSGETYHGYYGEIGPAAGNRPDDSSLFEIASISKVFAGALMARAVVDKKASLDADIRGFLPRAYPNLAYEEHPVTIKHLLTHTLGFETPARLSAVYDSVFSGMYGGGPIAYNMDDLFGELETVKLNHKPGELYDYNNVGPDLAAYILEQLYQKPYAELLQAFFNEMGMSHTYLQGYDEHEDFLVKGYTEAGELAQVDRNPLLGGASGIISSLPDLVKFMRYQLESEEPFIKEAARSLFKNAEENLGYLWDVGYGDEEGAYYLKSGTSNGVQSIVLICPDSDYGQILLMTNTSEEATNDFISLYNKLEYDLIKYPKINLWSKLEPLFLKDPEQAKKQYLALSKDTSTYFAESDYLNRVGYDLLYRDEVNAAIEVFRLAISADPENANLYDSLGEAYYKATEYEQAKESYEKSLELNPENENAVKYLQEIKLKLDGEG